MTDDMETLESTEVVRLADLDPEADSRERLLRSGEYLFARNGIVGSRAREISQLAGLRNPSALHYHFGSRRGLVEAILLRYQAMVDIAVEHRLDVLQEKGDATPEDVIRAALTGHVEMLGSPRGRDCIRIVPYMIHDLTSNIRRGVLEPCSVQSRRVLTLLDRSIAELDPAIRRERVAMYSLITTHVLAERATELEGADQMALTNAEFLEELVSALAAMLSARSATSTARGRNRGGRRGLGPRPPAAR